MNSRRLDDDELFAELARTGDRSIRNTLVERHMGLAGHIAKRFSRSSGADDDLRQVAMLGLVRAVDRFDVTRGFAFSSFAGVTIEGELKRYFRDKTWVVRVPRSAKELHLLVRDATAVLTQQHGRSPTPDMLATYLDIDRDDVLRGLTASAAATVGSIDTSHDDDERGGTDLARSGALGVGGGYELREDQILLATLMETLDDREREIVRLRFFEERSQQEIADMVGVSQMHVSRLLRRAFEDMRALAGDG